MTKYEATNNSARVGSGHNDASLDTAYYAQTGKDNREGRTL